MTAARTVGHTYGGSAPFAGTIRLLCSMFDTRVHVLVHTPRHKAGSESRCADEALYLRSAQVCIDYQYCEYIALVKVMPCRGNISQER